MAKLGPDNTYRSVVFHIMSIGHIEPRKSWKTNEIQVDQTEPCQVVELLAHVWMLQLVSEGGLLHVACVALVALHP